MIKVASVQGKGYELDLNCLGAMENLAFGLCALDISRDKEKIFWCNHGQRPEKDFGYGKS